MPNVSVRWPFASTGRAGEMRRGLVGPRRPRQALSASGLPAANRLAPGCLFPGAGRGWYRCADRREERAEPTRGEERPRAQRRYVNAEDVEAIEQVGPGFLLLGERAELATGGRDRSRIGAEGTTAAQSLELSLLQPVPLFRPKREGGRRPHGRAPGWRVEAVAA